MLETVRSVASLLLSYGLLLMANGLFGTLLGVRTKIEGFETEIVGVIMAGFFLGILLGGMYAARVVAAVGHIRAFAAFASIMSICALAHVLLINPFAWFAMRVASGFCMAGMIMVTESWLNERASNENRGRVLSLYMITNYFSAGTGQLLLPLADPAQFTMFSIASIIFSLALVPVLLTQAQAPKPVQPQRMKLGALFRMSPLGLIGTFCAGMVNAAFYGLGPVFAQDIGLSVAQTSTFMACVILGGLLLQWPVGRLSDRVDRRWVLIGVALATSLGCMGIVWTSASAGIWLFAMGAFYGGFSFTVYSLSSAHTNDFADRDQLVQTASGLLIAYGLGASSGPILASTLMGQVGASGMFMYSAGVTGLLGLYALYRMQRRAAKAREEKAKFVVQPGAQYTSEELYTLYRMQRRADKVKEKSDHVG